VLGSKIPHPLRNDSSIWALFLPVPASFILCVVRRYGSTVKSRFVSAVRLPQNNCVLHWYRYLGIMIARKRDDGLLAGPQPLNDQLRFPRGVGRLRRLAEQILNVLPTCRKTGRLRVEWPYPEAIAAEEANKAHLLISDELDGKNSEPAELQEVLESKDGKLADAQKAQAELIRKQREFDDARREFDLTVETRIRESLGNVRIKAKREVEDELKLKIAEREETIAGMQRQIEVPKQKDEQGSRQAQGEAQELAFESLLATCFLHRPSHA
jgi:hypothetical protein